MNIAGWWKHASFQLVLAFDNMGQIFMGPTDANPGVTISSRSGTAKAHGHRWGIVVCDTILAHWPFGPDADGRPHDKQAIANDIKRARAVLHELEDDPVVAAYMAAKP